MRALLVSLLLTLSLAACGGDVRMSPQEAVDGYATALKQAVEALEAVDDHPSAREAARAIGEMKRERERQKAAVASMNGADKAEYQKLARRQRYRVQQNLARFDDLLAALKNNRALYRIVTAENDLAP